VITAAHCVEGDTIPQRYEPKLVRLGEWDTSTARDCDTSDGVPDCVDEPVQDIGIERIIVHESYRKSDANFPNDIALIHLRQPATFNFYVSPICLPLTDALRQKDLADSIATVAGWGITERGEYIDPQLCTSRSSLFCRSEK
jgi:secreted trypsin-like serine protease